MAGLADQAALGAGLPTLQLGAGLPTLQLKLCFRIARAYCQTR